MSSPLPTCRYALRFIQGSYDHAPKRDRTADVDHLLATIRTTLDVLEGCVHAEIDDVTALSVEERLVLRTCLTATRLAVEAYAERELDLTVYGYGVTPTMDELASALTWTAQGTPSLQEHP